MFTPLFKRLRKSLLRTITFVTLFSAVLIWVLSCGDRSVTASSPCLPSAQAATMRSVAKGTLALGTNLYGVADWSTQFPFLDAFKSSRPWFTQCESGEAGCQGGWSTGEENLLDLDEQGWVKSIPAIDDPPQYTRVSTLLFREVERYPGGQYVVLYEGEGTIEYKFDAQKDPAASRPGRDVINVTPSGAGILLQLTATDPQGTSNYIRNIHVVPIEYETTFETEIFNSLFLDRIRPFQAVRFMDWLATNNSEVSEWRDRAEVQDARYATGKGVPLEVVIALANRLGVSPWINLPHKATDEYITNAAKLVKECLNPNLNIYVEFSNEVWNWQFQQAHYALEQGKARWGEDKGDAFMQWYGMRSAQMSDIWKQVFGRQRDRVVSVMATQTAWRGLENSALDCSLWAEEGNKPCYQHGIDVYAVTGYFSGSLSHSENWKAVESWSQEAERGFQKAFTQIDRGGVLPDQGFNDSLPGVADLFRYHAQVAQQRHLKLVAYEGGQHLVSADNPTVTDFFIALNRRPEMKQTYSRLLQDWQQAKGSLFMHFSDIGTPSQWGSWGALEHVDQNRSPKYDALMEFLQKN